MIVARLVKVGREEELAFLGGGAEQRDGVGALVVEEEELDAGLAEALVLEVGDVAAAGSRVDELIVVRVVELEAGDEALAVVIRVLEGEEGFVFAREDEVVVVLEVEPGRWGVVGVAGEAVQGGCDGGERAHEDGG